MSAPLRPFDIFFALVEDALESGHIILVVLLGIAFTLLAAAIASGLAGLGMLGMGRQDHGLLYIMRSCRE